MQHSSAPQSGTQPLAVLCVIGSCISLQLGSALAVQLFPHAGSWATSALRLLVAAVVLLAATRPKVWTWTPRQWRAVLYFGVSLGLMNGFFYAGIERVALGTAVTIEFLGPLLLAAVLSRSLRDGLCVALALAGMALLGWDSYAGESLDTQGVIFVLIAGFFWACYILASKHAGAAISGQGGLAVAFLVGGLLLLPLGGTGSLTLLGEPHLLLLTIGTGLLGSLVPYSLELIALRRVRPTTFSILIALEPVFAAFFGWLLLSQAATPLKLVAIAFVVAASIGQTVQPRRNSARRRISFRFGPRHKRQRDRET